jgi:hypothetical protein
MTPDIITTLVSSLGVVGALVWFLFHTTTKTIPDLTKQYTDSNERASKTFADTQEKITDRFTDTLAHEREYRKQEIAALQAWIKSEASCKYNQDRA